MYRNKHAVRVSCKAMLGVVGYLATLTVNLCIAITRFF